MVCVSETLPVLPIVPYAGCPARTVYVPGGTTMVYTAFAPELEETLVPFPRPAEPRTSIYAPTIGLVPSVRLTVMVMGAASAQLLLYVVAFAVTATPVKGVPSPTPGKKHVTV